MSKIKTEYHDEICEGIQNSKGPEVILVPRLASLKEDLVKFKEELATNTCGTDTPDEYYTTKVSVVEQLIKRNEEDLLKLGFVFAKDLTVGQTITDGSKEKLITQVNVVGIYTKFHYKFTNNRGTPSKSADTVESNRMYK